MIGSIRKSVAASRHDHRLEEPQSGFALITFGLQFIKICDSRPFRSADGAFGFEKPAVAFGPKGRCSFVASAVPGRPRAP